MVKRKLRTNCSERSNL